ncbi:MAG: helix-turn-helix transcriptional regulator [Archangiaceae bacterium]|nr:helix-turn-helix transcriptional regulator [Archangiaceae bacterium]
MLHLQFERDPERLRHESTPTEPTLLLPLESTVLTISTRGLEQRVDRGSFVLLPARISYSLEPQSAVAPTLTLGITDAARVAAEAEYRPHFVEVLWQQVVSRPRVFARTRWVDELANRYLFERQVCERHHSVAARFLETELTKELFFLGREQLAKNSRASQLEQPPDLLQAAQQWLEAHLFEPVTLAQLARQCHASESTLLRVFRRELGAPPTVYLRNRRLDEALLLLESRKYSASEVAARVGYANLSAFTTAFTRRFGTPPSKVMPRRDGAAVLPPHGAGVPQRTPPRPRRA